MKRFIFQLLQILHAQWLYHNFMLHHLTQGYLATKTCLEVLESMAELANANLNNIPEESRFLLEIDFRGLVTSNLDRQMYCFVAMQATITVGWDNRHHRWSQRGRAPEETVAQASQGMELSIMQH